MAALNQATYLLNIGFGSGVLFASHRSKDAKIIGVSWKIPLFITFVAVCAAMINFAYLGHVAEILNKPIDELPVSGTDLAFAVYPFALSTLPYPQLWSITFFLMMILLGIDSLVVS